MPDSPIPEPKASDHEDVSWALSTAAANWKRGDQSDALKWLQRAAESASETGADLRYLELAKAAAELAARIESGGLPSVEVDMRPSTTVVHAMPVILPDRKSGAPLPARTSAAPPRPVAPRVSSGPPRIPTPRTSSPPAKPSTAPHRTSNAPAVPPGAQRKDKSEEKKQRASRPSIQRRGGDGGRSLKSERPLPVTRQISVEEMTQISASAVPSEPPSSALESAPSSASPITEAQPLPASSDIEIEPWPTQASVKGKKNAYAYVPHQDDTIVAPPGAGPPDMGPETPRSANSPKTVARSRRPPAGDSDPTLIPDPGAPIPMQALHVVLYRTPDGVRVGLPGKRMEAMSIDAVLVALDANIDLASWLK